MSARTVTGIKQELYEKQRAYFSQPGARLAKDDEGACQYRVDDFPDESACAVGCLISNEFFIEHMSGNEDTNGSSVWELTSQSFWLDLQDELFGESFLEEDELDSLCAYLADTQKIHDQEVVDAADFVKSLDEYAAKIGLKVVTDDNDSA